MHHAALSIEVHSPREADLARETLPANTRSEPGTVPNPILDFIVSDETLDRCGEVITAKGWRLESYRRNPVFQNAHQYGDILFTLGKALITEVRIMRRAAPKTVASLDSEPSSVLYQRIQFATDVNPIARIAYGLYQGKFLNAVSVGFIPLRWQDDVPAPGAGSARPSEGRAPGTEGTAAHRQVRRYLEQELLEVSAVGIPANPNALALGLREGAIEKGDLREALELLLTIGRTGRPEAARPAGVALDLFQFARELRGILRRA